MVRFLAASVLILFAVTVALSAPPSAATSAKSMVATVHPLATDAGIAVLKSRGNAIDADSFQLRDLVSQPSSHIDFIGISAQVVDH